MKPRTRKENYLAKIAKDPDAVEMTPKTRTEHYLNEIAENGGEPFIVLLTPTGVDLSGTMDKTVAEIDAAWNAGREIWFRIYAGDSFTDVPCDRVGKEGDRAFPSFNVAMLYDEQNMLVLIYTGTTDNPDKTTYHTKLYQLTPAT